MRPHPPARARAPLSRAAVVATGVLVGALSLGIASAAVASWSTTGAGSGTAAVGTLTAPSGVTASSAGSAVAVSWAGVTPPEGSLDGYAVSRGQGATRVPACGTDVGQPATLVPATTLTCTDTAVPDGDHTYTVTAIFRSWTAESAERAGVTVETPQQAVTLVDGATSASLTGTTLYYRSAVAGSFTLRSTVTSAQAGAASATFPDVDTAGWTHASETVTTGAGGPTTISYDSSAYAWTASAGEPGPHTIVGLDGRGAGVETALTLMPDDAGPSGGALSVNGRSAGATPTVSYATADYPIDVRTAYAVDAGSGAVTSDLTVRSAPLADDVCGTFGPATLVEGAGAQTGLSPTCYVYVLTGTDAVGNTSSLSTVVKYDADPPAQVVNLVGGVNAAQTGTVLYFRDADGSFSLSAAVSDDETGPVSAQFPEITTAGWTHDAETASDGTGTGPTKTYLSAGYTFTATASTPPAYLVVGLDRAGNPVTTTLNVVRDSTDPTGGKLTVNGGVATTGGSSSYDRTGSFDISGRTDYTDAGSGIDTSTLTVATASLLGNTCGAYGAAGDLVGTPAQSGLTTGCYRYALTGIDRVGNSVTLRHTVKVDLAVPTAGAVTVNGTAADAVGTMSYSRTNPVLLTARTEWTDAFSGLATSTLASASGTLSNGACAAYGTSTTITGTANQTLTTPRCYRYTLTGTDNAGNSSAVSTVVYFDTTVPVSGALTVNAVAASAVGTTSFNKTGAFTIGARTEYSDAGAGIASSVLTVASAPLAANTCGAYDAAGELVGTPAQSGLTTGCYRYTLTGTDLAGNLATTTHTVKVDLAAPTAGAVTVNGTAADVVSTSSGPTNAASFPIDSRSDYVDASSGLATSILSRAVATYSAGVCGSFTGSTVITGTSTQSALATSCYRYTLTGTDNATNAAAISTIVRLDVTPPTAGALTVNAVAASGAGTTSTAGSGSFTIGTRTANTDAASGLLSSTLTREFAPLTGSTCGAFGSPVVIVGTPAQSGLAQGCHQYTLTGVDNVGNTIEISTTVKLGVYATAFSLVNGTGTAGLADAGDRVVLTFSDDLDVASMCSLWSGNGSDKTLSGDDEVTVTLTDGGAGNDSLSFASSACTLNLGAVTLASSAYTTSTVTFGGTGPARSTIVWTAATRTLTITLGAASGAGPATVAGNVIATYALSTAMSNPGGVPAGGTFATAAVKQF